MNCPVCGDEMERGKIATSYSRGLFFLPPEGRQSEWMLTVKRIEKQGGIVLDGPYQTTFPNETELPAFVCRACRKIVMEY